MVSVPIFMPLLRRFAERRAAKRTRAKLAALEKWGHSPISATSMAKLREAQALLAADEPMGALAIVDELLAARVGDVVLIVLWAQVTAALGRYREAWTINASAIKRADDGDLGRLGASCRAWQRELAWRVARES